MNKEIDITGVLLKTDRLILRPWCMGDIRDLYEYASVPGVGEWAGWPAHKDIHESQKIVELFIRGRKVFAIEYEGKVIGSLGIEEYSEKAFHPVEPALEFMYGRELGFVLSKDYWGRGIMTEAVREVIRWLKEEVKLDFITCRSRIDNDRSARVQEKCGFQTVGLASYQTGYGEERETYLRLLLLSSDEED